jgi:hypothetical protein
MNGKKSVVLSLTVFCTLMLALSNSVGAQVVGGVAGVKTGAGGGTGDPSKSTLEINREPIPTIDLKIELVEILPGGVNTLGTILGRSGGGGFGAMRVGSTGSGFSTITGSGRIGWRLKVLQIDKNGATIEVTMTNDAGATLLSQQVPLRNYEEVVIEVASAVAADKRLGIRIIPNLTSIPAVQDYPALVQTLTMSGLMILNGNEVVSRGSVSGSVDDLSGSKQQFFTIGSRSGLLVMSYRPFPGAILAGYFQDKKLLLEWNGDYYEWISLDKPFLPEGKWSAYIWQADTTPSTSMSVGGFTSDPSDLPNQVTRIIEVKKRMEALRKKQPLVMPRYPKND